jgi:lysine 2,3-aminomutase
MVILVRMNPLLEQKINPGLKLTAEEIQLVKDSPMPPFQVTGHWISLLDGSSDDPLRRQVVPTAAERMISPGELEDPLGEGSHSPLPRLVHRYSNRALVVVTGACALYCRHCFRRRLSGDDFGEISDEQAEAVALWLRDHKGVKELLLSGGDPLTMNEKRLMKLMDLFRRERPDIVFRLATRIPVVDPRRITASLARNLGRRRPIWVVIQVNHPRELSRETLEAIDRLQLRGLPVINQAVLLKGINDDTDVLEELSDALVRAGVKPYYLFQGDLARGTAHFRVPLEEGLRLTEELRSRTSGLGMPSYAVDLPGGGGKVPLGASYISGRSQDGWELKTPDGHAGIYKES